MMLSQNGIGYLERSDDRWMTARKQLDINGTWPGSTKPPDLWYKSYEVSLLGCADQYQACNPNKPGNSGSTELGGNMSAVNQAFNTEIKSLGFNVPQIGTISRFLDSITDKTMWSNVYGRGGAALNGK